MDMEARRRLVMVERLAKAIAALEQVCSSEHALTISPALRKAAIEERDSLHTLLRITQEG